MRQIADFSVLKNIRPDLHHFINGNEPLMKIFNFDTEISPERVEKYKALYSGIGSTCTYVLRLENDNILHLKMEYLNPMGNNHYSRYWIPYLFLAETIGMIKPTKTKILEVSSGSAGISLAMAAKELAYDLTLVLPSELPSGRLEPIKHFGANIIFVNGYIRECMYKLRRLIVSDGYFAANHSDEKGNVLIKVMKRIAHEFYQNNGKPDYIVSGIGNGSSTLAMKEYFTEKNIDGVKYIGYYPKGINNNIVLGLAKDGTELKNKEIAISICDKIFSTEDLDTDQVLKKFKYDTEIIGLGPSSIFGIAAALKLSETQTGKRFLAIGYDKKDRY